MESIIPRSAAVSRLFFLRPGIETDKQIIRRFAEEVLNQGSMATLEEVCAADLLNHNSPPRLPGPLRWNA